MPSQSVPRICIHLLDGSSRSLSPSGTLDIRDILARVKLLPSLLAEGFAFNDADDILYTEDSSFMDVPPFPLGRQPPFFVLHPHRARLLYHMRSEAPELGDFSEEPNSRPLLSAPTSPRMKLLMKEQLYLQKWIDTLTSDNPPNHVPWACDKLVSEEGSIVEDCVFPAATAKPSIVTNTDKFVGSTAQTPHSRDFLAFSDASALSVFIDTHTSMPRIDVKSAGSGDLGILLGGSKASPSSHRTVRAPQSSSSPKLPLRDPPPGIMKFKHSTPLAARRGKSLSGLKLEASIIEQLEYPDFPTAFLGTPCGWSPRFDTAPVFTDHDAMLLNLRSKYVALGGGDSTITQESPGPPAEMIHASPDEWAFTRGLETFADDFLSLTGDQHSEDIVVDTNIFLPDDSSSPANRPGLGGVHRLRSIPASESPADSSFPPPIVPLPPRPALVSPLTPPHVRGILKKAKNVRFEDMVDKEAEDRSLHAPQASSDHFLPLLPPATISPERPGTPIPTVTKRFSVPTPTKEAPTLQKNFQERKPTPRPRLPRPESVRADGTRALPACPKPTSVSTPVERPCRITHLKENATLVSVATQRKQKGLPIGETNVRRGIEGPTKNRLSVPLRNIFRFR